MNLDAFYAEPSIVDDSERSRQFSKADGSLLREKPSLTMITISTSTARLTCLAGRQCPQRFLLNLDVPAHTHVSFLEDSTAFTMPLVDQVMGRDILATAPNRPSGFGSAQMTRRVPCSAKVVQ